MYLNAVTGGANRQMTPRMHIRYSCRMQCQKVKGSLATYTMTVQMNGTASIRNYFLAGLFAGSSVLGSPVPESPVFRLRRSTLKIHISIIVTRILNIGEQAMNSVSNLQAEARMTQVQESLHLPAESTTAAFLIATSVGAPSTEKRWSSHLLHFYPRS